MACSLTKEAKAGSISPSATDREAVGKEAPVDWQQFEQNRTLQQARYDRWTGRDPERGAAASVSQSVEPREARTPGARQDHLTRRGLLRRPRDELMRMVTRRMRRPGSVTTFRRYSKHLLNA